MKFCVFVVFILVSYVANSQGVYIDPDNLSFSDYKGKVNNSFRRYSSTYCGISASLDTSNGMYNCKVYPIFFRDSSWIDFKYVQDDRLMDLFLYEQLHYCITVLVAKEFKSYLLKHPPQTVDEWLQGCKDYAFRDRLMRSKYDADTYSGYSLQKQNEWRALVNRQLDSLKNISLDLPK
jgi:hypothetical protein